MTDNLLHTLYAAVYGQAPTSVTPPDHLIITAALLREAMRWSPFFRRRRMCRMICILRDEPMNCWWHHKEAAEAVLAAVKEDD